MHPLCLCLCLYLCLCLCLFHTTKTRRTIDHPGIPNSLQTDRNPYSAGKCPIGEPKTTVTVGPPSLYCSSTLSPLRSSLEAPRLIVLTLQFVQRLSSSLRVGAEFILPKPHRGLCWTVCFLFSPPSPPLHGSACAVSDKITMGSGSMRPDPRTLTGSCILSSLMGYWNQNRISRDEPPDIIIA